MRGLMEIWAALAAALSPAVAVPPVDRAAAERCAALSGQLLADGTAMKANFVPAGPFLGGIKVPNGPVDPVPSICRITLTLKPTSDSQVQVEVWLPAQNWNGRFLGAGNGGFAGSLNLHNLALGAQRGYATMTTDTGHVDSPTSEWAKGHPEKVIDYAHRGVHLATLAAKQVTERYYGRPANKAYFSSCSNGGRQGLMEALRYPDDYDGIISGAPAADFIGVFTGFAWSAKVMQASPVPRAKNAAIGAEVIRQCDRLDGFADGVIDNPPMCRFDPTPLTCRGAETDACLTPPQVDSMRQIYRGPRYDDSQQVFPALSVGGEVAEPPSQGWDFWLMGTREQPASVIAFTLAFMRDIITGDPKWSLEQLDPVKSYAPLTAQFGPLFNAKDPAIDRFVARGGKLMLYHGWSDPAIPPLATVKYHQSLIDHFGEKKSSEFSRLYMVPGMQHCWFGPGAWSFNPFAAKPTHDAGSDMAAALERWVEKGIAPDALMATKPVDPIAEFGGALAGKTSRTSLICPYPQVTKYRGNGARTAAGSYRCVAPST